MKATPLFLLIAAGLVFSSVSQADEALAKSKGCLACHTVDKKLIGPTYKEVARKYAGQKDAEATLVSHVLKGSKDVWGPVPMPANANVTEAEAKKLVAWVLSLK